MSTLITIAAFVVAIGVLVTVHEFGHFWVARRLGVRVLRFSVGFGAPLWRRVAADGVEYVVAAVPLGGYVKMLDEREGPVPAHVRAQAFNNKSLAVRTAVVAAGPAFNFVFAVLAYWCVFLLGVNGLAAYVGEVTQGSIADRAGLRSGQQIVAIDGEPSRTWVAVVQRTLGHVLDAEQMRVTVERDGAGRRELDVDLRGLSVDDLTEGRFFSGLGVRPYRPLLPAVIEHVEPGSAGARAGLRAGDQVLATDGEPVSGWGEWVERVQGRPGEALLTTVERDGARIELDVVPGSVERDGQTIGFVGVRVRQAVEGLERYYVTERYGPVDAFGKALDRTWEVSVLTVRMFWKMLRLEVSLQNLSGPITIARYAGDSARSGPVRFFEFLAIVSISLGILNLLPIPILDGGHLLYFAVELVKGSPPSEAAQYVGQHLGLLVLVGLMGLAFYNDIARLLG